MPIRPTAHYEKTLDFLGTILCGLAALVGLFAGGGRSGDGTSLLRAVVVFE